MSARPYSGVKFKSSPHFTVRPQYCTNVRIDRIHIENDAESHGTNGVVFDSVNGMDTIQTRDKLSSDCSTNGLCVMYDCLTTCNCS